jgi:FkbM family methyltransferase
LFKLFCFNNTTVVYTVGYSVIVIPGVASCWRDVVNGREYALQAILSDLAPKATGFLDCGANMGYFSCLMARLNSELKIVAVEPLKECLSYLKAVRRINGFMNIEIVNAVLSDCDGVFEFSLPQERFGESGGLGGAEKGTGTVLVRGYSLDSLLERFTVEDRVIIKVDIEGFESVALRIPPSPVNSQKVFALCVEVHLYRFSRPWPEFSDLLRSIRSWFPARWFITKPRCLQGPLRRYWNRVSQREEFIPLDTTLVKGLVEGGRIQDLYLFGIRGSL